MGRIHFADEDMLLIYLNFPIGSLDGGSKLDAVFDFEDILMKAIEENGVGNFDGNEFCEGPDETSVTFFIYGPDANVLYETVKPFLSFLPKLPGSYILKQSGDRKREEEKIDL